MPFDPCAFHGEKFVGKPVTAYTRWSIAGVRHGFRQKSCVNCATERYAPVIQVSVPSGDESIAWPETCLGCGVKLDGDVFLTWLTFYRGQDRKDYVMPCCEPCTNSARETLRMGAQELPDRDPGNGAKVGGATPYAPDEPRRKPVLPW